MPTTKSSVTQQQNLLIAQQATRATNGNRLSSPSVSSPASISMLQSPSSSSGAPQAGSVAVISTSMASPSNNTMSQRHPTPTNILAQHLQRGLTPKANIQGLPSNTTTGHQQMGSYNQNTGISKGPNNNINNMMMASPSSSCVSTTTLSLISTTG